MASTIMPDGLTDETDSDMDDVNDSMMTVVNSKDGNTPKNEKKTKENLSQNARIQVTFR